MSARPCRDETEMLQAIERVRSGDREAFDVIYYGYIDAIQRLCRSRLGWADRCIHFEEDLASEILTAIWMSIHDQKNFSNADELWFAILRVVLERCIDRARYNQRSKRTMDTDVAKLFERLYGKREFAIGIAEVDLEDTFKDFLKKLPDSDARGLIDLKQRGLTNEQIADQQHVDIRTVQRRLKALSLLFNEVATTVVSLDGT